MQILYSYNKRGDEAIFWQNEISSASNNKYNFVPINHGKYVDTNRFPRAQRLDGLYYDRDPSLMRLYEVIEERLRDERIPVLLVDNLNPYHPDWLRKLPVFKVLRIADGPLASYDRDFAYAHAFDLILFHSPAYSQDMPMAEKLNYIGAKRIAYWPLGVFEAAYDPKLTEDELFSLERDVDIVFVGAMHVGKMPLIAQVKRAFGRRCQVYGLTSLKRNIYFNLRYGFPGWIRSIPQSAYVPLYKRAKIGFNAHNRGKYTVGSYRLFELPANGVMQISDGDEYLQTFFEPNREIVGYSSADDLIDRLKFYLENDNERVRIARNGYSRVMRDYKINRLLNEVGIIIERSM